MAADVNKNLDRAKNCSRKIALKTRSKRTFLSCKKPRITLKRPRRWVICIPAQSMPERAAVYYGYLFDILVEPKDETKALAIFNRFLRSSSTTNHQNVSHAMRFCSKSKIIPRMRWIFTPKRRKCLSQAGRGKTHCFAGSAPHRLNRKISRAR